MEVTEDDPAAEGGHRRVAAVKGTVRALADSISLAEAERASKQVREAITQQRSQLEELQRFSDENKSLSELVLELPESVSHRIMVPFGKVAFFPGRMIHTNEFLVLLGENHFAERSAKQTVEILDRRSEFLDQKMASAKAQIADMEAESSFVTSTAEEAKAGLVEIREEYQESEHPQPNQAPTSRITAAASSSEASSLTQRGSRSDFEASTFSRGDASVDEDHELHLKHDLKPGPTHDDLTDDLDHDLLMARLSELELAEAAAGEDYEDVFEEVSDEEVHEEVEHKEVEDEEVGDEEGSQFSDDEDVDSLEGISEHDSDSEDDEDDDYGTEPDEQKQEEEEVEVPRGGRPLSRFAREATAARKTPLDTELPQEKVTSQMGGPNDRKSQPVANKDIRGGGSSLSDHSRVLSSAKPAAAGLKAFTGVVTEHSSADSATANNQQVEPEQNRPVSKFKMSLGRR